MSETWIPALMADIGVISRAQDGFQPIGVYELITGLGVLNQFGEYGFRTVNPFHHKAAVVDRANRSSTCEPAASDREKQLQRGRQVAQC